MGSAAFRGILINTLKNMEVLNELSPV